MATLYPMGGMGYKNCTIVQVLKHSNARIWHEIRDTYLVDLLELAARFEADLCEPVLDVFTRQPATNTCTSC